MGTHRETSYGHPETGTCTGDIEGLHQYMYIILLYCNVFNCIKVIDVCEGVCLKLQRERGGE